MLGDDVSDLCIGIGGTFTDIGGSVEPLVNDGFLVARAFFGL